MSKNTEKARVYRFGEFVAFNAEGIPTTYLTRRMAETLSDVLRTFSRDVEDVPRFSESNLSTVNVDADGQTLDDHGEPRMFDRGPALPATEARLLDPETGRRWHLRVIREGDRYGRDDILTHDSTDPLVEFHDAEQNSAEFGPRGQFVARYYLSSLTKTRGGVLLDGGIPSWTVSADVVRVAVALARRVSR